MKKKTFFSLVTVVVLVILLAISFYFNITNYFPTSRCSKVETHSVLLETSFLTSLVNDVAVHATVDATVETAVETAVETVMSHLSILETSYQMFERSFDEMILQSSGINLLYCRDFNMPIVHTVNQENWKLINEAVLINFSDQKNLHKIELQSLSVYWEITSFSYLYTDLSFCNSDEPPSDNWIELLPDENGNYQLPLNPQKTENGYAYTAIKYTAARQNYYGLISIGPN